MNKAQAANPNSSGTSSETSESQSVEENQAAYSTSNQSGALNRAKNSWKRMKDLAAEKEKENEAKRPPWRAVSVSTLSKPDKSALLRAKLLDASRRLRAGKANVAIQTDFVPTKLMKEASLDVQSDLILYKDVGILTDGQLSKKKDDYQQYILTYSMSQMTDTVPTGTVSTQTLLPKVYHDEVINSYLSNEGEDGNALVSDVEKRVVGQIEKMRKFYSPEDGIPSLTAKPSSVSFKPTLASWNFDDVVIDMDAEQHFIPYTIEPCKPWRSFVPLPFRLRGKTLIGSQRIDWYALLRSVDDLIRESNNLVDKLDQIMEAKNDQRQIVLNTLNEIPTFKPTNYIPPSDYWLPIIEQQERELQIMMENDHLLAIE